MATEYAEEKVLDPAEGSDRSEKTIFLIGDSITLGYREYVKKELEGYAQVIYPQENGRCTQYVIISLRKWSGLCDPDSVDLVQFNCGHWDIAHWNNERISLTSVEEYCNNLLRISDTLRRIFKNAKIVFATTTRMNPNGANSKNYRFTSEIIRYNAAAKDVLESRGIIINDLFDLTLNFKAEDFADYCHMTECSKAFVGHHCASLFRELLGQSS